MKKASNRLIPLLFLLFATASSQLTAQQAEPRALVVAASNRTAEAEADRGAKRADARLRGGDVVRYRLAFTNLKDRPVREIVMSNPIPAGLKLIAGSVSSSRSDALAEFSADGGKSFSEQPMEEVMVDGALVKRAVSPDRYTHVRWTLNGTLAPQAVVTAQFEARLGSTPPAASTPAPKPATTNGR